MHSKSTFALVLSALTLLGASNCQTAAPGWNARLWAGDSVRQSIRREQEAQEIRCAAPQFDNYVCVTYEDLRALDELLSSCEQWRTLKGD